MQVDINYGIIVVWVYRQAWKKKVTRILISYATFGMLMSRDIKIIRIDKIKYLGAYTNKGV